MRSLNSTFMARLSEVFENLHVSGELESDSGGHAGDSIVVSSETNAI